MTVSYTHLDVYKRQLYTIQRLPEFIPATQNGKPVAFRMTVALRFENR